MLFVADKTNIYCVQVALHGYDGADLLYGDVQGAVSDFIAQGSTQAASGLQSDLVDGESGDDQIFTGAGNDLVAGGAGDDLIVTGGGNDYIAADWSFWHQPNQWQSWSVTESYNNGAYSYAIANLYTESDTGTGNDTIYAGAGDDVVSGERGNDTLYLESGNDKAWGGEGADVIWAGQGLTSSCVVKLYPKSILTGGQKLGICARKTFCGTEHLLSAIQAEGRGGRLDGSGKDVLADKWGMGT